MATYQVIARRYRPQQFRDVLGQNAIVTTLQNAMKRHLLAHAYLFCGSRGTGKTTLARIFAKALNCQNPTDDFEPCNKCRSCLEITSGNSLDVLEIDGASHRGIDDIRQINDTVGYAAASGKFKIYIIDEVHMLTKEAFNALLKTLEEPPPHVKFFFATTEPHKVPTTILSRCQRFNLNRIPVTEIMQKLRLIAQDLKVNVQDEALFLLASRADGGLRDAESLFDQILAFHEGEVTANSVAGILGIMPRDCFFELDRAGKEANLSVAFDIAHQLFAQGKDVGYFIESLTEHFRNILMVKLSGKNAPFLLLSDADRERYEASAKLYSQEQCLTILDMLTAAQNQRISSAGRIAVEAILLRILRTHQRVPLDYLVRRLAELEQAVTGNPSAPPPPQQKAASAPVQAPAAPTPAPVPKYTPPPPEVKKQSSSMTEDPTPTKEDLKVKKSPPPVTKASSSAPVELGARPTEEARQATIQHQSRYDTLLQFASVELEGKIQKTQWKGA